ncbi:hypothetical protein [Klenkia soli]|uniref:hypothetical protein n=1 Tax=Klenkia soli TaxID=1052260 RepID=UPI0010420418|nr:hypothetical protein [Klenkia soli]
MDTRAALARERWRQVLPTAVLLTGDVGSAWRLVVAALAGARPVPPGHDGAVVAVVRTFRRRRVGDGATLSAGAPVWWLTEDDLAAAGRLADALAGLTRDERAAVVLRFAEDWPPARIRDLVPGADPDTAARRLVGEVPDPTRLPERLASLAAAHDASAFDDDAAADAVGVAVTRRRRRAGLAVVVAAAAVAGAVLVPDHLPGPVPASAPSAPVLAGAYAGAPRGELADDPGVLPDLQRRLDAAGLPGSGYRLVYGGDVDGTRVVLMGRAADGGTQLAWLTGAAGSGPGQLTVTPTAEGDPTGAADDLAAAVAVTDPDRGRVELVVVAAEGTEVQVSPGVDVDPALGSGARDYREVPTEDGVAVLAVDRSSAAGVRYAVGPGAPTDGRVPLVVDAVAPDPGSVPTSRSGTEQVAATAYAAAVDAVSAATSWAPADLAITVLGAGSARMPTGQVVETATVAAVLPGGAVVTTTGTAAYHHATSGGYTAVASCGGAGHPAGTDLARLVVATDCVVTDPDGPAFRFVVVAAPPGAEVTLTAADGSTVVPDLAAGWGWVSASGAAVVSGTDGTTTFAVVGSADDVLRA